jgi:hypothetical protein
MTTLNDVLDRTGVSLAEVRAHMDSISPSERVRQATSLDRNRQGVLWTLAAESSPVTMNDLVPDSVSPMTPVPFEGQNSAPLFRNFRKVFYRQPNGSVGGRNESSVSPIVGDGFYSVVTGGPDGVYIDYTRLPGSAPSGWPKIKRNDRGVSLAVYGFMKDYLRRVHGRIFIGHAVKPIVGSSGYFVLARPD